MTTVSLCMIVKNEQDTLGRCLESVRGIADEIVVVDTGSTDGTKEIAARYTKNVHDFQWIDDFSAARNFAFSKAGMDCILWLDADDILLPEDRERFLKLKEELSPDVDAVMMKYNAGFDAKGNVTFSYYRERLVRRERHFHWREPVHEYIAVGGNIIQSEICVTHAKPAERQGARNLRIYEALLEKGRKLSPRGQYYYARELKEHERYGDAAREFALFLDSGLGWTEDNIAACGELAGCFEQLGNEREELAALTRSFQYDTPRAEILCQLGYYFKKRGKLRLAAYWFEAALRSGKPRDTWGFVRHECYGYIPSLECAVCYDGLGDYAKAELYNELAASFKPDSPAVAYNRDYFARRKE